MYIYIPIEELSLIATCFLIDRLKIILNMRYRI